VASRLSRNWAQKKRNTHAMGVPLFSTAGKSSRCGALHFRAALELFNFEKV